MEKPINQYDVVFSEYFGPGIGKKDNGKYCLHSDYLSVLMRAETAEAKLAELEKQEKQEPVAWLVLNSNEGYVERNPDVVAFLEGAGLTKCKPLFTRPAPAINLAGMVPDEMTADDAERVLSDKYGEFGTEHHFCCDSFEEGANWQRSQILRNIEEEK